MAEDPWLDHWHVYIHYCSSDTWAGTRAASQHTGGFTFHGRHILAAVLRSLAEHHGLLTASSVVLTGTSAGAQGAVLNCDLVAARLQEAATNNTDMEVRCVANAPEFYPPEVHTAGCRTRQPDYQDNLTSFWGRQMDESCLQFAAENGVDSAGELCGVTANFVPFVSTPLVVLSSHEDTAFTAGFGCAPAYSSPEYGQFRAEWMAAHSGLVTDLMADWPEIAFYAPNCRGHVLDFEADKHMSVVFDNVTSRGKNI